MTASTLTLGDTVASIYNNASEGLKGLTPNAADNDWEQMIRAGKAGFDFRDSNGNITPAASTNGWQNKGMYLVSLQLADSPKGRANAWIVVDCLDLIPRAIWQLIFSSGVLRRKANLHLRDVTISVTNKEGGKQGLINLYDLVDHKVTDLDIF